MSEDERYIHECIALASRGEGRVEPNPFVGCIIVKDGKIIAKGYHRYFGGPHAEVYAIRKARHQAKGATLYVNLEPCCFYGKTPPCTDLIIKSGIKKVVFSIFDPNPLVNGKGARCLKKAGVKVAHGVSAREASFLNRVFIKNQKQKLPYVILKWAMSLDGKIATKTGDSKWISSEESRKFVRDLRKKVCAVAVGVNTVIEDDPSLLVSTAYRKNPARIIFDTSGRTPINCKLVKTARKYKTIIVVKQTSRRTDILEQKGCQILVAKNLKQALQGLYKLGYYKILVEGGGKINAALLEENLADEFFVFIAPKIIGGEDAITPVEGEGIKYIKQARRLRLLNLKKVDGDILMHLVRDYGL